jgi:hypothetical protein
VPIYRKETRDVECVMARKSLIRPWTAGDSTLLEQLLREGKSYDQIARRMKRSQSGVKHRAERLTGSERRRSELGVKGKSDH